MNRYKIRSFRFRPIFIAIIICFAIYLLLYPGNESKSQSSRLEWKEERGNFNSVLPMRQDNSNNEIKPDKHVKKDYQNQDDFEYYDDEKARKVWKNIQINFDDSAVVNNNGDPHYGFDGFNKVKEKANVPKDNPVDVPKATELNFGDLYQLNLDKYVNNADKKIVDNEIKKVEGVLKAPQVNEEPFDIMQPEVEPNIEEQNNIEEPGNEKNIERDPANNVEKALEPHDIVAPEEPDLDDSFLDNEIDLDLDKISQNPSHLELHPQIKELLFKNADEAIGGMDDFRKKLNNVLGGSFGEALPPQNITVQN